MEQLCALNKIAFTVGGVEVAWYGIIIVIGMIAGLTIVCLECKRINLNADDAVELFLWVIPLAVIFCRIFYTVLTGGKHGGFRRSLCFRQDGILHGILGIPRAFG